jgi:hypothetical protein
MLLLFSTLPAEIPGNLGSEEGRRAARSLRQSAEHTERSECAIAGSEERAGNLRMIVAVENLRDGRVHEDGFDRPSEDAGNRQNNKFVELLFGSERERVGHDDLLDR